MVAFNTALRTSVPEEYEVAPYTTFEKLSAEHPSVSTTPVMTGVAGRGIHPLTDLQDLSHGRASSLSVAMRRD